MTRRIIRLSLIICIIPCLAGYYPDEGGQSRLNSKEFKEAVYLLETWIESVIDYDRLPGVALAVVHDQEIVYARGFGYADLENKVEAAPDTIYSVCSISKLFTSIALMQLRDAGKLSLDDPVSRFLPWFRPQMVSQDDPEPTLRDLLRHSSGLPCEPAYGTLGQTASREELIEALAGLKMSYSPNTTFNYSNLGYTLIGEVISSVSGMEYADYVQENILDPLGMDSTTPRLPADLPEGRLASGYGRKPRETGPRVNQDLPDWNVMSPAGGFYSSVRDLAKFAMWQFRVLDGSDVDVLGPEALRQMQSNQWADINAQTSWGLGFAVLQDGEREFYWHYGGCPGYKSQFVICPQERIAVAVIVNASDAPQWTLAFETYEILGPALLASDAEADDGGPSQWAEYVGLYTADDAWSEAEVLEWDGSLAVLWVPSGLASPLRSMARLQRIEGNIFRQATGDGQLGKHFIFEADAEGNIVAMRFNNNRLVKTAR